MNDILLKQMADELAEIRKLLAAVLGQQASTQDLAETKAEIAMVDAHGIDAVSYLKDKCRRDRKPSRTKKGARL